MTSGTHNAMCANGQNEWQEEYRKADECPETVILLMEEENAVETV